MPIANLHILRIPRDRYITWEFPLQRTPILAPFYLDRQTLGTVEVRSSMLALVSSLVQTAFAFR